MNREIKFRAWDIDMESMYEIAGFTQFKQMTEIQYGASGFKRFSPDRVVLLEFTGMKDKRGVEIYEGDILEMEHKYTYEVKFDRGQFICVHGYNSNSMKGERWGALHRMFDPDFDKWHVEVIGNIFQNPELCGGAVLEKLKTK